MSWTVDSDLQDLLDHAQQRREDFERGGGLAKLAAADEQTLDQALVATGAAAGCPDSELALVVRGRLRPTRALEHTQGAISHGWGPGSPRGAGRPWIVLHGGVGAGKTTAAVWALLRGTVDAGRLAHGGRLFVTSRHIAEMNAAYGPDRERLDRLSEVRWLVIDDLGSLDSGADGDLSKSVQRVLEDRHARRRRTMITTNIPRMTLAGYLGGDDSRLADRMHEIAVHVATGDSSLRRSRP